MGLRPRHSWRPGAVVVEAARAHSVDLLRIADHVDWLLEQDHEADSPHVQKLGQSPDGTRAGLGEATLMEIWNDLRTVRREALSVFK